MATVKRCDLCGRIYEPDEAPPMRYFPLASGGLGAASAIASVIVNLRHGADVCRACLTAEAVRLLTGVEVP